MVFVMENSSPEEYAREGTKWKWVDHDRNLVVWGKGRMGSEPFWTFEIHGLEGRDVVKFIAEKLRSQIDDDGKFIARWKLYNIFLPESFPQEEKREIIKVIVDFLDSKPRSVEIDKGKLKDVEVIIPSRFSC